MMERRHERHTWDADIKLWLPGTIFSQMHTRTSVGMSAKGERICFCQSGQRAVMHEVPSRANHNGGFTLLLLELDKNLVQELYPDCKGSYRRQMTTATTTHVRIPAAQRDRSLQERDRDLLLSHFLQLTRCFQVYRRLLDVYVN